MIRKRRKNVTQDSSASENDILYRHRFNSGNFVDFPFHMRGFPTLLPRLSFDRLRIRLCSTRVVDSISE